MTIQQWDPLLRHPLVTLLVGAALTGLVVPRITRQWQLRQKRLEVKTVLVAELSELVMRFLMAVQFVHPRSAKSHSMVRTATGKSGAPSLERSCRRTSRHMICPQSGRRFRCQ